jgi:hypothetical protein
MTKIREWLGGNGTVVALVLGIAAAIIIVGWIAGRGDGDSPSGGSSGSSGGESTTASVLYEVEGTAESATITAEMPTGTSQGTGKTVPLTTTSGRGLTNTFPRGAFVYISAQNEGATGDITCRITVDGVVISENAASGGYAIATCQGTAR